MKKFVNPSKGLIIAGTLFFGLTSCNKRNDIQSDIEPLNNPVSINNNFDDLNKRMRILHEPILFTDNLKKSMGDYYGYTWYLVAEVDAPIVNGKPLSATDVRILGDKLGDKVYVSYHRQGNEYAGGVDIIDISDRSYPSIRSYMSFSGIDINSLAADDEGSISERQLWLAGSSAKKGAILRQINTNDDYFSSTVVDVELSKGLPSGKLSASANGVGLTKDYVYATSGSTNGGTYQINRNTLQFISTKEYSEAKAVAINNYYQLSLIGGDKARLLVYEEGKKHELKKEIALGSIVHQNVADPYFGKATVSFGKDKNIAFIAMNSQGMKAIDIDKGTVVYTSPATMLTTGNTHGLAVDDEFVYMANSDDGMFIGRLPNSGTVVEKVQNWDLAEKGASVNMVQTDGDWVFVAKGGGGLKILRKVANSFYTSVTPWDNNGRPTILTNESFCNNLITDFTVTLPEGQDATKKRPEYFQNTNREIVLTANANVSVSFVREGAGYRNTLGYYTYNVNNPPKDAKDLMLNMKIIFANASASGSGGTLNSGDKVELGTFSAGTVIGYFLIADGWNGTKVTEGLDMFFSRSDLNKDKTHQSIMMYHESCGSLLTTFEDIHIKSKSCDLDYNDLVIKTSISPMSAMNTTNVNNFPK